MRIALALLALTGLSGCINMQAAYDNAAWQECMRNPNDSGRRACVDRVQENGREKRADQRASRTN